MPHSLIHVSSEGAVNGRYNEKTAPGYSPETVIKSYYRGTTQIDKQIVHSFMH